MKLPRNLFHAAAGAASLLSLVGAPAPANAQSYPIDCAILLCLSGGWPGSVPCVRARAEFIRRITPWPIEPPLQIWRCPMGASFNVDPSELTADRIYEILMDNSTVPQQSFPPVPLTEPMEAQPAVLKMNGGSARPLPEDMMLQLINGTADIDISGKDFDFVRSIRVFHVRLAMQAEGDTGGCDRMGGGVELGTYGPQGGYRTSTVSYTALPAAHTGMEGFGQSCPSVFHRSVFVDWRDHEGKYGFEQVNY
ncbi:hypothetical protein [uncultured Aliiroseovarius sp.]|uniref:hypothetical protein n=1 Tax=uncultured Aliiroseovarius sp. TaxID=1658783 RepID=UPI0026055D4B|nr:hypothetical protein [uncultured Aliiroseovarius sp.]